MVQHIFISSKRRASMKHILTIFAASSLFFNTFSMDLSQETNPTIVTVLKKSHANRDHVATVLYSHNGEYFFENISDSPSQLKLYLRNAQENTIVKTFPDYNYGQFSTNGRYAVLSFSGAAQGSMPVAPLLYSIQHNTCIPLLANIGDKYSPFPPTIELSSNNRYIKINSVNLDTHSDTNFLMQYNDTKNLVTNVDLSDWGTIARWQFTSDGNSYEDPQHMLYIKDGKTLTKRDIASGQDVIAYQIDANGNMYANGCLVSLVYDSFIKLLFIKNNTVEEIKSAPYPDAKFRVMHILHLPKTELIIYQSGPLSFCILDKNYRQVGSYSLKNAEGYQGSLQKLITNDKESHLVAMYDSYGQDVVPSRIICFDLSAAINKSITSDEIPSKELKCTMQILALKFIANKKLLTQGSKTKIIDLDGDTIFSAGESQSSTIHGNSILTIYHTPFDRYQLQDVMNTIPAKTKLTQYIVDKALLDD